MPDYTMVVDQAIPAIAAGFACSGITLSGTILLVWALTGRME
jgi:hypothetical protein